MSTFIPDGACVLFVARIYKHFFP
ncbi:MAG: hypothetical protein V7641_99, partial [Blastocatellia bacterium]